MSYNNSNYSLENPEANHTKGIFYNSKSGKTIKLSIVTQTNTNDNTKLKRRHNINSNIQYLDFFIEPVVNLQ